MTREIDLVVRNVNQAPRLMPMPLQLVQEGQTLAFTMLAADADNDATQLALVYDQNTPAGVSFDPLSGNFEWTPGADLVDNAAGDSRAFSFNFSATDGSATTLRTVQVRVFDVNRAPAISTASHAMLVGQSFSLPMVKSATAAPGSLRVSDADGAAQTQALSVSFSNLPEGASYDAAAGRLNWTPGPGQVGDFVVIAQVSDGRNTTTDTFTLRVVAEASANEPKILVNTTPSTPVLPGQTVVTTVRASAFSPIANIQVQMRGAAMGQADWIPVTLDNLGRVRLTATAPGLIELRVSATDADGFVGTTTQTIRVRDPLDTAAPQLAWGGSLEGGTLDTAPVTVAEATTLQAHLSELQLMGWKLEIAPANDSALTGTANGAAWRTLAQQDDAATASNALVSLATLDPSLLANGVYRLRLSAPDLTGRISEIETRVVIDSATKALTQARTTDAVFQLGDHAFALTRDLATAIAAQGGSADGSSQGEFGNWAIRILDTHLTHDQAGLTPLGAVAPWLQGARVWLQVPASVSQAEAAPQYLSFTLSTTTERLANQTGAPTVLHPVFSTSNGWTLQAVDALDATQPISLQRQGLRLLDQATGLPWVPQAYVLTGPDGTRYTLNAQGKVQAIAYADGQQWLVSDAGIALVGANDPSARIEFVRNAQGRIERVAGPAVSGDAQAIAYRYDAQGRLVLARSLYSADAGRMIGYHDDGSLISDPITANLGAAVGWLANAATPTNTWSGMLNGTQAVNLSFTVRDTELASTVKTPGAQGAVIIAVETTGATVQLQAVGATVLGRATSGARTVTLLRLTEAGLKLLTLQGQGNVNVRVSLAGDLDRDGDVDGADSVAWEQGAAGADINGDGVVNASDRQVLYANYGWRANHAPVAAVQPSGHALKAHVNLSTERSLASLAQDLEGDSIFWRVLGAAHGTATLSADGQAIVFTPEAGYAGEATVIVQPDDGFAVGAPIALNVHVSSAPLRNIAVTRLPILSTGTVQALQITGDFADEVGVALPAGYCQISSDNPGVISVDANGFLHAKAEGVAVVTIRTGAYSLVNAITVAISPVAPDLDRFGNELNVYPLSIDLSAQGGQRQIDVHVLDGTTLGADIGSAASGTRYFISDPSVADISADGLVTAKSSGAATITVIHGGRQGTMQLKVRVANTGPTIATVGEGVVTQDEQGNTLTIGAHALSNNTLASISSLDLGALQTPLPASDMLPAFGAVHIDLSGATSSVPIQLALKVTASIDPLTGQLATLAAGTEVFFWQEGEIRDATGVLHKTWWLMDNGVIGSDGVARTSSTPYVGITGGGNILVTGAAKVDSQTGAAKISGALIDFNAIWSSLAFAAIMPTPIMAMSALTAFGSMNALSAVRYTIEGSYQLQIPKGALLPNSSVSIPAPPSLPLDKPAITGVQYNPTTRQLTVSGVNFIPLDQASSVFKLKLWLVPIGDQIEKVTAAGTAPVNGLIWQPFEVSPQADGTLRITLPEGVALSQHDIYVERAPKASLPPGWYGDPDVLWPLRHASVVYAPTVGANASAPQLSASDAQAVLSAARLVWQYAGADMKLLDDVTIKIEDLAGNSLSYVDAHTIVLSRDAAKWGWYLGTNPDSDSNFAASYDEAAASLAVSGGAAKGHIDLLTTVLEQLGAILGVVGDGSADSLMNPEVPPGMRRLIGPSDIPGVAKPDKGGGSPTKSALRDLFKSTRAEDAPIYSALIPAAPPAPSVDTLVTTANTIDIFQPGGNRQPVLIGQIIKDNQGKPLELSGAYASQIVFNDDGTLAFIAGRNNNVYVFDTMTQDIVVTYTVAGASSPISSLAVNDGWLYVAEGSNYSAGGRLVRINIDSGPDFLKKQQTLAIPDLNAPLGFRDLAINSGRYLAVTAPTGRINISNYPAPSPGNVYVIDLFGVGASSKVDPAYVKKLDLGAYPSSYLGKGPLYINSGEQRGQFLVSNAKDISKGAAGITFKTDAGTGKLSGSATVADTALKPDNVPGWLQAKYQQNIQRAADTVVLKYQGKTYALVADYNFLFNDVHFVDYENYGLGKQIGGKIGVIQDPFGEEGGPVYLGATTPIPGVALDQLILDQNGMLYASGFVEDTSGYYTGGNYSDLMYRSIFVWNASQLVQAAINAQQADRKLTLPIDRDGFGAQSHQYPEVTPARYDTAGNGQLFGWIYGMGTYSSKQALPRLTLQDLPILQKLAPSVYTAAQTTAIEAKEPMFKIEGTAATFIARVVGELTAFGLAVAASTQAILGQENDYLLGLLDDTQQFVDGLSYNTRSGDESSKALASAAQAVDGLIGGMTMIGTNGFVAFAKVLATDKSIPLPENTDFTKFLATNPSNFEVAKYVGAAFLKYNPVTLAYEGAYRATSAAMAGDWDEARDQLFNELVLFAAMGRGENVSRATLRELQLRAKQLDFIEQRMRRGVIEESPLKDLTSPTKNVQEYIIESSREDANGVRIADERIIPVEDYAKAAEGMVRADAEGKVDYVGCFVAGTLIHTADGLVSIEKIRVGTQVLSQPEDGGELGYRRVINKVAHLDQPVMAVQIRVASQGQDEGELTTIFATPNHPFWVESPQVDRTHWMAAECLEPCMVLQLADGRRAEVRAAGAIRRTQHADIFFAADERVGHGQVLCLSHGRLAVASVERLDSLGPLTLGEPFVAPVYNFEVEEFHTYYVGQMGVWVHNTNCNIARNAALEAACFDGETTVHVEELNQYGCGFKDIEQLQVGDKVLSRCEITGEMAYKRVLRVFCHGVRQQYNLSCKYVPELPANSGLPGPLFVTEEHPFWVKGKGWIAVRDLQVGDEFVTYNGVYAELRGISKTGVHEVFNIEVEDFHTYFVHWTGLWVHNEKAPVTVSSLSLKQVEGALPEWSPLYKKAADLTSGGVPLNQIAGIQLKEQLQDKKLVGAGIKSMPLADFNLIQMSSEKFTNTLGKIDKQLAEPLGYPDRVWESATHVEYNGLVVDYYEPTNKATPGSIIDTLSKKTENQSSAIEIDMSNAPAGLTIDSIVKVLRGEGSAEYTTKSGVVVAYKGPLPGLKWLLVVEADGFLRRIDFQDTGSNGLTYGKVYVSDSGIRTVRLDGPVPLGEPVFIKTYSPDKAVGIEWQMAETADTGSNSPAITLSALQSILSAARQYWLNAGASSAALDLLNVNVGALADNQAGMTQGEQITLSADGAGWGWFVDPTPMQQEEFSASDTSSDFKAPDGSVAAGKLDLLTVLIHEMGHALGLGHSSQVDDVMDAVLTPGERRLPSADDSAGLRAEGMFVATNKVFVTRVADVGRITSTNLSGSVAGLPYELAPNPQLTHGDFGGVAAAVSDTSGWLITGNVTASHGTAVLTESAATQTDLSQFFYLGTNDRLLTFTVANRALTTNASGPNDAFEVALRDANTGLPVAGKVALGHTDALLNLQTDGTEFIASGVRKVVNPDGSATYIIDLPAELAGKAVYLSFDLLGFGAAQSHVSLRDVRLIRDPQATNDMAATNEDTATTIAVLGNDITLNAAAPQVELVTAPQHGTATLNADGTVNYAPFANYHGADTFSYRFDDGGQVSTIATVQLQVASVNDAPVLTSSTHEVIAGEPLVFYPLALASDVDGDVLTVDVITALLHGTLEIAADGRYTYTPDSDYSGEDVFAYRVSDGVQASAPAEVRFTVQPVTPVFQATNGTSTLDEDGSVLVDLRSLARGTASTTITPTIVQAPTHGALNDNGDGTYTYVPVANYHGGDSLRFSLNDGTKDSNEATVSLTVVSVNDAPVLGNQSLVLPQDTAQLIGATLTASDVDGDALIATIVAGPAHGTLILNDSGSFTYTPSANYVGADSFSYRVSDGQADSNVATVSLNVSSINKLPQLVNQAVTLDEDGSVAIDPLASSDAEGDSLTAAIVASPAHGSLTVNADGSFSYQPETNYFGADSFSYRFLDTAGHSSNTATVQLSVRPVNDAPVAPASFSTTVSAGTPWTFDPLTGASDVEGSALTVQIVNAPAHGSLATNADGSLSYTPDASYSGHDTLRYVVSDGEAVSTPVTVQFTVLAANTAPVAADATLQLLEDGSLRITPVSLGADAQGNTLTGIIVTEPAHGTLSVQADGSWLYTPKANFNGTDSFTYRVNDGHADSNVATVTLTVTPVNDAPVLGNSSATVAEDGSIVLNPLTTASDVDGDTLTASIVAGPAHGTLTVNANGTFTYKPAANFNGTDSFTYRVNDGQADSNVATVMLTVTPVNDAPVLGNRSATVAEDGSIVLNPLTTASDVDGDTLAASIVAGPAHGTLTGNANGTFTYKPTANFNGTDSFTYRVNDGQADSNVATVTLTVTPVNDAPVLGNSSATVAEDCSLTLNPLASASDVDGDTLTASIVAGSAHGTLTANTNGTFTYKPAANFNGTDSFTYRVNDGQADSNVATLTLTVTPENDAPVLGNSSATLAEDSSLTLNPLASATDVDGDPLTSGIVSGPAHGIVLLHADGRFSYVPDPDFNGSDSFTYRVSDGQSTSGIATVALTITAVNDAPVAQDVALSVVSNASTAVALSATDGDNAAATLGYAIVTAPQHGSVARQADGQWRYTPTTGYVGSDNFTYKANDGQIDSNVATVRITVTPPPATTLSIDLGIAGAFNVFSFHDFTSTGSDTEGAIAAGNDLTLANYSVNANGLAYHGMSAVVGGNFTFYGGSLHGTATCGASQHTGQLSSGDVVRQAAPDFSFTSEAARLTALSDQLATLPATGNVTAQWGGLTFTGDGRSAVQVFSLSGAELMSANWSSFANLSPGQTVIVNVTGTAAGFTGGTPNGFAAYNTLFNFSQAQTLNFNNVGVVGTILAPRAQVNGGGGQINGNVIVKDWNSGIQINANHYWRRDSVTLGASTMAQATTAATTIDTAVPTPASAAQASPQVGSAAALVMTGLPLGSVLSDGSRSFTVTEQASVANLTGWNIARLSLVPPRGYAGTLVLQVRLISHAATDDAAPPDANPSDNPFVSFTAATGTSTPTSATTSPQIVVGPMALEAGLLTFSATPAPRTAQDDEEDATKDGSSVLSDASLLELEQFAKASWLGGNG